MDTQEILDVALRLAKQSEVPADTTINVPAKDVKRALIGIDVDPADLLLAKEKGYDLVIAHHPTGGSAILDFPKVLAKHGDILQRHGVPIQAAAPTSTMESTRYYISTAMRGPSDGCGSSMAATVPRTSWSRAT